MFEIPLASRKTLPLNQERRAKLQTARMVKLISHANKLTKAGWPIEWTISGLAFDVPRMIQCDHEEDKSPAAIRQKLIALGIADEFRLTASRSLLDVVIAQSECADRSWYAEADHDVRDRALEDDLEWDDVNYIVSTRAEMVEMEDRYGRKELIVDGDYQRGTVNGRKEAFDWLFGEEWPDLEPPDDWKAEEAREVRAYGRTEEAIKDLHTVLFGEQEAQVEQAVDGSATLASKPSRSFPK